MRKCPFCGAELEENARFCLYCMTSLDEKTETPEIAKKDRRWLYIAIAAVLILITALLYVFLFLPKTEPSDNGSLPTGSLESSDLITADSNETVTSEDTVNSSLSENTESSGNTQTYMPDETESTEQSTSSESPQTQPDNTEEQPNTTNDNTDETQSEPDNTQQTSSEPTLTVASYSYIEATAENAYPPGAAPIGSPQNAVVIIAVSSPSSDGCYIIPETLDGKKVAAIMPQAFASVADTVKSVTLPSSVKTVWGGAFDGCTSLTDIYIGSAIIEIYPDAFPASENRFGTLTIHCKYDCINFNYRYFRNIAADTYGAVYSEWNG